MTALVDLLMQAVEARQHLLGPAHQAALRIFNGFTEGERNIVIDLYASTLVLYNYAEDVSHGRSHVNEAQELLRQKLSWLRAGVVKIRNGTSQIEKRGQLLFGKELDRKIQEHGVWYAIDLTMNRDASFYLDTRNLRRWLFDNMRDRSVLNTFAYTGSLGAAAMAGGASRVVQLDLHAIRLRGDRSPIFLDYIQRQSGPGQRERQADQ
jgi:23S rRNA (cytosine1962-C5)-methyltransferase